jgi:hypothetical protein
MFRMYRHGSWEWKLVGALGLCARDVQVEVHARAA